MRRSGVGLRLCGVWRSVVFSAREERKTRDARETQRHRDRETKIKHPVLGRGPVACSHAEHGVHREGRTRRGAQSGRAEGRGGRVGLLVACAWGAAVCDVRRGGQFTAQRPLFQFSCWNSPFFCRDFQFFSWNSPFFCWDSQFFWKNFPFFCWHFQFF